MTVLGIDYTFFAVSDMQKSLTLNLVLDQVTAIK